MVNQWSNNEYSTVLTSTELVKVRNFFDFNKNHLCSNVYQIVPLEFEPLAFRFIPAEVLPQGSCPHKKYLEISAYIFTS